MTIRKAAEEDLPDILTLYAQPDMDGDKVLPIGDARAIFRKMELDG